jgi:hypothetical protein
VLSDCPHRFDLAQLQPDRPLVQRAPGGAVLLFLKPPLPASSDGGIATCMQAATGEIVWQERLGGDFSATPVFAEGRVHFLGDNGETTVLEAGPAFKLLAKNPLGEKVQASLAVSQGHLFIRTAKQLVGIGSKRPRIGLSPRSQASN